MKAIFSSRSSLAQTLAGDLQDSQRNLGFVQNQAFQIVAAHDTDQAVFHRLGEGVVQLGAEQGHFAKKRMRAQGCNDQFLAFWADPIELDTPFFENEEDLAWLFRRIEERPLSTVLMVVMRFKSSISRGEDFETP